LLLASFVGLIRKPEAAARELARLPVDAVEQAGRGYSQRPGELCQGVDAGNAAAALKQADLGAVQPA